MKKLKILLTYISSNRVWIITLACLDLFFIFLAWLANPDYFINYVALIIFVSFAALAIPLAISIRKRNRADVIFRRFLLEPDDTNEYLLCEAVPAVLSVYSSPSLGFIRILSFWAVALRYCHIFWGQYIYRNPTSNVHYGFLHWLF